MDKKITIPAGIALMVVLAVAGMLAIFSYTAATPVQAAVVADTVTYSGPTLPGATGDVTIGFDTDATLAASSTVVINFPAGFEITTGTLTGVTVDTAPATAVAADAVSPATGKNVTVTLPSEITHSGTDVTVSIVIPGVTAPATGADYDVTVTPDTLPGVAVSVAIAFPPLGGLVYDGPDKPGKADSVEVMFVTGAPIAPGDVITIYLHEDFTVPDPISRSDVEIDVAGDGNLPSHPNNVTIDDSDIWNDDDWLIELRFQDVAPQTDDILDPIPFGSTVTVTIAKAAGIVAPTESDDYEVGVSAGNQARIELTPVLHLDILVTLSEEDGGRGDTIVATAKGITDDGTADFWRDADGNGEIDGSEEPLPNCSAVPVNDNVAECTFTLTSDFSADHGSTCTGEDENIGTDCNLINVRDGASETADIDGEDDVIELKKSITLSPAEGNPGDKITVQLFDFKDLTSVSNAIISGATTTACGAAANFTTGPGCDATVTGDDANFTITIPSVPPGTRKFIVNVNNDDDDTTIVIGGASLLVSPDEVLPNQGIRLTGSGYSDNSYVKSITIGGDNVCDGVVNVAAAGQPVINVCEINDKAIRTDSGGSWSVAAIVPITSGTADGGNRVLTVTDLEERSGRSTLAFAEPSVSIAPEEGRVGSTITIVGENFPVANTNSSDRDIDVDVTYDAAGDADEEETVRPDASGRWQVTLRVPNDAHIPSTNVLKVQYDNPDDTTTEIKTFKHRVPRATLTLSPASGPEGSMVTATASGFKRFTTLKLLTVGNNEVAVSPRPSTDRDGNVTFSFQMPGLDPGVQNVTALFDITTASQGYVIVESSGVVGAVTSGVDTALGPLMEAGTLDRVFYFNNATKSWQWHIVDDAFAASNNLIEIVSGAPLWVLVTEDTSVTLNNRVVDFTCAGDDCWNLITFP